MKRTYIIAATIAAIGIGLLGAGSTFAAGQNSPVTSLVDEIATKFNLNKADVQAVFDNRRSEMKQHHEQNFENRLSKLVTEGKITEAQKSLIIAKHNELLAARDANKDAWKNMSPADRKAAMDKQKDDLQTWATQNGIDIKYLLPFGSRMSHRMEGMMNK